MEQKDRPRKRPPKKNSLREPYRSTTPELSSSISLPQSPSFGVSPTDISRLQPTHSLYPSQHSSVHQSGKARTPQRSLFDRGPGFARVPEFARVAELAEYDSNLETPPDKSPPTKKTRINRNPSKSSPRRQLSPQLITSRSSISRRSQFPRSLQNQSEMRRSRRLECIRSTISRDMTSAENHRKRESLLALQSKEIRSLRSAGDQPSARKSPSDSWS